jgi:hypothetical protein
MTISTPFRAAGTYFATAVPSGSRVVAGVAVVAMVASQKEKRGKLTSIKAMERH